MNYEKTVIAGKTFWRVTPDGEWKEMSNVALTKNILKMERDNAALVAAARFIVVNKQSFIMGDYDGVASAAIDALAAQLSPE